MNFSRSPIPSLTYHKNMADFTTQLKVFEIVQKHATNVITPVVQTCIFCKDIELILQPRRFAKAPTLYTRTEIGKSFTTFIIPEDPVLCIGYYLRLIIF